MRQQVQFQEIVQLVAVEKICDEDGDPRGRLKNLGLDIREEGNAAIGVRVPQWKLSVAKAGSDERRERKVIVAKIPGDHEVRRKNDFAVENQDFRQQYQEPDDPTFAGRYQFLLHRETSGGLTFSGARRANSNNLSGDAFEMSCVD